MRRTPGLRREELAALAGVSIDYLTRLEQGKETNPSAGVLDALAGALLLDPDAHAHLYALANQAAHRTPPAPRRDHAASAQPVRPAGEQLLERLRPSPAYVLNRISDMLAANPEARWGLERTRLDLDQGTVATYNALEAARLNGVTKFVFSSSGTVSSSICDW